MTAISRSGRPRHSRGGHGCHSRRKATSASDRTLSLGQTPEPRLGIAVDHDGLEEHGPRPNPEPPFAVQGAINDERFLRLRMPGFPNDLVLVSFIVPIATWLDHRVSCRRSYI